MSAPTQSYVIWFSQRVGSTLLARALEDTGVAGRPREWFNAASEAELFEIRCVSSSRELRELLWRQGTTPNGVLGLKYGVHAPWHETLTAIMRAAEDDESRDERAAWAAFFPNCRHIFATRRNKVRLAVSWWRAIKSGEGHRQRGAAAARPTPGLVDLYDYDAIEHLFTEANLREAAMQDLFDRWGVVPHTVVYEDLIADFGGTVRRVLEFLELPGDERPEVPAPAFERLADDVSEAWVERFRRERQAAWANAIW